MSRWWAVQGGRQHSEPLCRPGATQGAQSTWPFEEGSQHCHSREYFMVCMHVYIYIYIYIYNMHVCMYFIFVCRHLVRDFLRTTVNTIWWWIFCCEGIYLHVYTCVCVCTNIHRYICMHVYVYIYIHIYIGIQQLHARIFMRRLTDNCKGRRANWCWVETNSLGAFEWANIRHTHLHAVVTFLLIRNCVARRIQVSSLYMTCTRTPTKSSKCT